MTEWQKKQKRKALSRFAYLFEEVGKIEKEHEERYRKLLANIEKDEVFAKRVAVDLAMFQLRAYPYRGKGS